MTIKVYTAFTKKQNSTKQPLSNEGTEITCRLKEPTSIINPVFILESHMKYNYVQWSNRYYFVNDIIFINNTQCEYHCTVDPMASWKTSIGNLSEFVTRSSSSYSPSIIDGMYPVETGVTTDFTPISDFAPWIENEGRFILGVVNGSTQASGSLAYYALDAEAMSDLRDLLFSSFWLDGTQTDITLNTQKQLINPFQYIVSCMWFPFNLTIGTSVPIRFGWWSTADASTPVNGKILGEPLRKRSYITTITLPAHPQAATRGSYLNNEPFTNRVLYMYAFGRIPLDASYFTINRQMVLHLQVDLFTGVAKLTISNGYGDKIFDINAQMGVPVQLSQISENYIKPTVSALDFVGKVISLDFAGAASSIETATTAAMPTMLISGSTGTVADYFVAPSVISEFRHQTPMDNDHFGRPLCQNKVINTLSGYIKTENAEVDIPATQVEREMIANIMNSGFYYE